MSSLALTAAVDAALGAVDLPAHLEVSFAAHNSADPFGGPRVRVVCRRCKAEEAIDELLLDRETAQAGPHAAIDLVIRFLKRELERHEHLPEPAVATPTSSAAWRKELAEGCRVLAAAAERDAPVALLGYLELMKSRAIRGAGLA